MADLRASDPDRGQIVLVAALVLALAFVALAIVVNSAIFTENLATRSEVPGSADALEYRHEVAQSVGALVTHVNMNESEDPTAVSDMQNHVSDIGVQGGIQQSSLGRVVNVSHASQEDGDLIAQTDFRRNFTSASTGWETEWQLAGSVSKTRNVQFSLNLTNDPLVDAGSDGFRMYVEDTSTGDFWNMTVDSDTLSNDNINVRIDSPAAGSSQVCERDDVGDNVSIDLSRGTVAGEPCPALSRLSDGTEMWFANNLNTYDIHFQQADEIEGTFSMVVEDGTANPTGDLATGYSDIDPYVVDDALYSLTVEYTYNTPSVVYETVIEAAPGEVPP